VSTTELSWTSLTENSSKGFSILSSFFSSYIVGVFLKKLANATQGLLFLDLGASDLGLVLAASSSSVI
jgi:hypothetical protein